MIFLIITLIIIDQFTKYLAFKHLSTINTYPVMKDIFHLTYVENRGAAFGILQNKRFFFIIITTIVLAGIIYIMYRNNNLKFLTKISLALVVAGAIGNLIDRIRLHYVIDFFDFRIWPVFNVADVNVVIGGVLLCIMVLFFKEELF